MSCKFSGFFFTKLQKKGNYFFCVLCCSLWSNHDLEMLDTSKWLSEPNFCEIYQCQCSYLNWFKRYDIKYKFVIFSPVANIGHQSLLAFWFLMSKPLFFSGHRNVCRSLHTKGLNLLTKEESRGKKKWNPVWQQLIWSELLFDASFETNPTFLSAETF